MSLKLETSAGYVDSEYSDFETTQPLSTVKKSSPKFGGDDIQWCINRNVPYADAAGLQCKLSRPIRHIGPVDFTVCEGNPSFKSSHPGSTVCDDLRKVSSDVCLTLDESSNDDLRGNEFRWWCDEQEVSDLSVTNIFEEATPVKLDAKPPVIGKKLLNDLYVCCDEPCPLSDRTCCGSGSSEEGEYNDLVTMTTKSARDDLNGDEEWSSFMKPVDSDEEIGRLKRQILYRLGFKLEGADVQEVGSRRKPPTSEAVVQTCYESFTDEYREYELKWLRDVNEVLVAKLIEIMNTGKLMAYKTEQVFIESLQSHLKKSQNEIERLLHFYPDSALVTCGDADYKQGLLNEINTLKAENLMLRKEVEVMKEQVQNNVNSDPSSDRARALEKKLKDERISKKVLMDDFSRTLGYMRMMKDRLKTLSHDKRDRKLLPHDERIDNLVCNRRIDAENSNKAPNDMALKGCIKRSNTTSCTSSKQDRVKFAETSDVYYLPKRSNSELGPFVTDTNKQMPILPCKIGPADSNDMVQDSGGLMSFFKNIKETLTGSSKPSGPRVNILKVPNNQRSQTRQQIDMYKRHLISRGLNV